MELSRFRYRIRRSLHYFLNWTFPDVTWHVSYHCHLMQFQAIHVASFVTRSEPHLRRLLCVFYANKFRKSSLRSRVCVKRNFAIGLLIRSARFIPRLFLKVRNKFAIASEEVSACRRDGAKFMIDIMLSC